jgi:electron transfer flavoprotein beta subunit
LSLSDGKASVTREVDAGLEVMEVELPAVITTDLRLNEPRYVKLPDIMKAKKKPLDVRPAAQLEVDLTPQFSVVQTDPPAQREKGVMVSDVAALVNALQEKGLV